MVFLLTGYIRHSIKDTYASGLIPEDLLASLPWDVHHLHVAHRLRLSVTLHIEHEVITVSTVIFSLNEHIFDSLSTKLHSGTLESRSYIFEKVFKSKNLSFKTTWYHQHTVVIEVKGLQYTKQFA